MAIDLARRQAVMARSQKLGHCICNPKHPCPCPPLIEHNVCPCAGVWGPPAGARGYPTVRPPSTMQYRASLNFPPLNPTVL